MTRWFFLVLAVSACEGQIGSWRDSDDPEAPGQPAPRAGASAPPASPPSKEVALPKEGALPRGGARLLTADEYRSTIADLFGVAPDWVGDVPSTASDDAFTTVAASEIASEALGGVAEKLQDLSMSVAGRLFARPERQALVGCTPAGAGDPCVARYLATLGRRAWRRPLTAEEQVRLQRVATAVSAQLNDVWKGLEHATAALLGSPHFLFRLELGAPTDSPDARKLDGHELAARLSYFLWGSGPDEPLLDAAGRGELDSEARVRAQAARLAASPRARTGFMRFLREHYRIDLVGQIQKDAKAFPQMTSSLAASMRGELDRLVADVVFERRDLRELYRGRTTFVDATLAKFYGLTGTAPSGSTSQKVTLPPALERAGLLGTAGFLASTGTFTRHSAVVRGVVIGERLLCRQVPPPPAEVDTTEFETPGGDTPMTMRQRLERHRLDPACAGCHSFLDPPGLALEHFDGIGRYRATDNGLPIDAGVELEGKRVDGLIGLAEALAVSPGVASCFAEQVYRYATGNAHVHETRPALEALARRQEGAQDPLALAVELSASPAFRFVGPAR